MANATLVEVITDAPDSSIPLGFWIVVSLASLAFRHLRLKGILRDLLGDLPGGDDNALVQGVEYAYGQKGNNDGSDVDNHRIVVGFQFY